MKQMFTSLSELNDHMRLCTKCPLCKSRTNVVCGEGNENAQLMIIAEAPGYYEDKEGRPFRGRAGKVIDAAFEMLGIKRQDVFISNIVKCNPPSNRNPEPEEIAKCLDYLRNQVILIKPKVIILLGSVAVKTILGNSYSVSRCRGQWINKRGINYIATWHPAAVLRDEEKQEDFLRDFRTALEEIE